MCIVSEHSWALDTGSCVVLGVSAFRNFCIKTVETCSRAQHAVVCMVCQPERNELHISFVHFVSVTKDGMKSHFPLLRNVPKTFVDCRLEVRDELSIVERLCQQTRTGFAVCFQDHRCDDIDATNRFPGAMYLLYVAYLIKINRAGSDEYIFKLCALNEPRSPRLPAPCTELDKTNCTSLQPHKCRSGLPLHCHVVETQMLLQKTFSNGLKHMLRMILFVVLWSCLFLVGRGSCSDLFFVVQCVWRCFLDASGQKEADLRWNHFSCVRFVIQMLERCGTSSRRHKQNGSHLGNYCCFETTDQDVFFVIIYLDAREHSRVVQTFCFDFLFVQEVVFTQQAVQAAPANFTIRAFILILWFCKKI